MIPARCLFSLPLLLAAPIAAQEIPLDGAESVLAVVTHKGGFAAGKAHNHLIAAPVDAAELVFDPAAPLTASFSLDFAAEDLTVDPWEAQQAWFPRLEALGILDEAFTEMEEKDRLKIRQHMLGGEQLDAAAHRRISARLTAIEESPSTLGGVAFPFAARLVLEVHGQSVEKPVAARWESAGGTLRIEAVGTYRFSDFGIKPFSAFFGAVKNLDEFHVYLNLSGSLPAEPTEKAEAEGSLP